MDGLQQTAPKTQAGDVFCTLVLPLANAVTTQDTSVPLLVFRQSCFSKRSALH